jgi:DNA-binding Xre family transcriptional regulator
MRIDAAVAAMSNPRHEGLHSNRWVPEAGRSNARGPGKTPHSIERWLITRLQCILQCCIPQGYNVQAARSYPKGVMVRLKVHELMATRGISAYKLCLGTDLTYPSAYRLSRAGGRFGRLHAETLDQLCRFFQVQPGKLLQWVPADGS